MSMAIAVHHHVADGEGFSVQSDGLDVEDHENVTQRDNLSCSAAPGPVGAASPTGVHRRTTLVGGHNQDTMRKLGEDSPVLVGVGLSREIT